MFSFNGTTKVISLAVNTRSFDVRDLYSRWKEWVQESDNAKYLPAMRTTGGDPILGQLSIAPYYFLMNGWQIAPDEADHTLVISGNIAHDDGLQIVKPTSGDFHVLVSLQVSANAQTIRTSSVDSDLLQEALDQATIAARNTQS